MAGLAVGALGIDAARHVRRKRERALVAVPLVLAAHQLVEVLVWRGLDGEVSGHIWRPAMTAYLLVAFGVMPVLVPLAVGALEPTGRRLQTGLFTALGAVVAVVLVHAVVRGPVDADIEGHHIAYAVDLWHGGLLVLLYVIATCGALLFSSRRYVRRFGVANLVSVVALSWLYQRGFISLWCGWAAVTSAAIAWHLRRDRDPERVPGATRSAPAGSAA